jgi:hypothetical protein
LVERQVGFLLDELHKRTRIGQSASTLYTRDEKFQKDESSSDLVQSLLLLHFLQPPPILSLLLRNTLELLLGLLLGHDLGKGELVGDVELGELRWIGKGAKLGRVVGGEEAGFAVHELGRSENEIKRRGIQVKLEIQERVG